MSDVVTLTMNPAIDLSVSVERVTPFHKLRSSEGRRDPGGGGINVARVMKRLGADVTAIYPAGGTLGLLLRQLVEKEGISQVAIPIAAETREDFTVNERVTGFQYRFVVPGPSLTEHEWHALQQILQLYNFTDSMVAEKILDLCEGIAVDDVIETRRGAPGIQYAGDAIRVSPEIHDLPHR